MNKLNKLMDMAEGDLGMLNKDIPMSKAEFAHWEKVGNHLMETLETIREVLKHE